MFTNAISIQGIISMISILVSSGAIGYIVRLVVKIEVLQTLFDEKQGEIEELQKERHLMDIRLTTQEGAAARLEARITNVDKNTAEVPKIMEKLTNIEKGMDRYVPEKEIHLMVDNLENKLQNQQDQLRLIQAADELRKRPVPQF